jgi:hypothetical protein
VSDKKAILTATVDKLGRVVCPTCSFKIPVPVTHALSQGTGMCPNGHPFVIDDECVAGYHHFTGKTVSAEGQQSKVMLKNRGDVPAIVKDMQDQITEGGIILP